MKKGMYIGSDYMKGFLGESLTSRARSTEILRVAKQMAETQHAEVLKKLENASLKPKTKAKILRSLRTKTR